MKRILFIAAVLGLAVTGRAQTPTFNREVVRIFQQNCQTCHRPGDIGPFSLMDYRSALPWSARIKQEVSGRKMPPWKPVPGVGEFVGTRILSPAQIDTIARWVDAGTPEGDPRDLPPPLTFSADGWTLGEPDLVLRMEPFSVPQGGDLYRCFSLPTDLTQDRTISGIEVRAGNRAIVHHVLLFSDPYGYSLPLDQREPGQGYTCFGEPGFEPDPGFFGGWAPGIRPAFFAPGLGMQLRAGSRVAMQVHYHTREGAAEDQTQVGVYFSRTPVDKFLNVLPLLNRTFVIPAGASRHEVRATFTSPPFSAANAHLVSIAPHMHLLGREIRVQATLPGGPPESRVLPLIRIDDWDFDWQGVYDYVRPVPLPGGTRLDFSAFYDNSAANPRNPNSPPVDVRWGERTTDEMALVFFVVTLDAQHEAAPQAPSGGLVNAASFRGGGAAPGAIVSLFGSGFSSAWEAASTLPLPRRLAGGTRVTVGGVEAPLFYVSPAQINFQVPFEVTTPAADVVITRGDDGRTATLRLTLGPASPGIFTFTSDGTGPAAALHAEGGAAAGAANPAARGEWLSLYATGLGPVTPAAQSGAAPASLSSTVTMPVVMVGNSRAEVSFAGLAPGFAGLYQVNFRVPADAVPGSEMPLKLLIGSVESNTTKLAIR